MPTTEVKKCPDDVVNKAGDHLLDVQALLVYGVT